MKPWFVIDEGGATASEAFPGLAAPIGVIGVTEKGVPSVELGSRGAAGTRRRRRGWDPRPRIARAITRLDRSDNVVRPGP